MLALAAFFRGMAFVAGSSPLISPGFASIRRSSTCLIISDAALGLEAAIAPWAPITRMRPNNAAFRIASSVLR